MSGGVFSLLAFWMGGAGVNVSAVSNPAFAANLSITDAGAGVLSVTDPAAGSLSIRDAVSADVEVT